jgi:hypothetical protein
MDTQTDRGLPPQTARPARARAFYQSTMSTKQLTSALDVNRDEFECWYNTVHKGASIELKNGGTEYFYPNARAAWRAWKAAKAIERESCAKIAEDQNCHMIARRIRNQK